MNKSLWAVAISICFAAGPSLAQSGYQTINGTRVFTQVFPSQGYARFSNDCGSQQISQKDLQAGALPNEIIPCPRPSAPISSTTSVPPPEHVPTRDELRTQIWIDYDASNKLYANGMESLKDKNWLSAANSFRAALSSLGDLDMLLLNTDDRVLSKVEQDLVDKASSKSECLYTIADIFNQHFPERYYSGDYISKNYSNDYISQHYGNDFISNCTRFESDADIAPYFRLAQEQLSIGPVGGLRGTDAGACPSGFAKISLGYGNGWACKPYSPTPSGAGRPLEARHQSSISIPGANTLPGNPVNGVPSDGKP